MNSVSEKLVKAAAAGKLDRVKALLAQGANAAGADDGDKQSQAFCEAAAKGHTEIVALLLKHGADIHAQNEYALRRAAMYRHEDTFQFLIDKGANVEWALELCIMFNAPETIAFFVNGVFRSSLWRKADQKMLEDKIATYLAIGKKAALNQPLLEEFSELVHDNAIVVFNAIRRRNAARKPIKPLPPKPAHPL